MKKEIIILVIILIIVIVMDIITQSYTDTTMSDISNELNEVRNDLVNKEEKANNEIKSILDKWNEYKEKLVIYIEHTELEKVEMYIIEANSHIETGEYSMAIQTIDTCKFIIDHIEDKYKFCLKNIF